MKTPVIVALVPTDKNNIVRALVVHWETGEILYRREYVTVDLFDENALSHIVSDIENNFPVYIHSVSLPTRGSD